MINEETNSRVVVKVRPQRSIKRHKTLDSTENNNLINKSNNHERRDSDLIKRRESIQKEESENYDFSAKVSLFSFYIFAL